MRYYAQINENNICFCVKTAGDKGIIENLDKNIEIPSLDESYMWKKFDTTTKTWSTEKFEPTSTAPIDEFTTMKSQVDALNVAMANLVGGVS